jgi:hypothetical protein
MTRTGAGLLRLAGDVTSPRPRGLQSRIAFRLPGDRLDLHRTTGRLRLMTIGSLFFTAVGAMLNLPATVDVAGVELGTIGVILLILVLIGGLLLSLWALWVVLFFIGSR